MKSNRINSIKSEVRGFGKALKMVGYDLPKTVAKRTLTNQNQSAYFKKKK